MCAQAGTLSLPHLQGTWASSLAGQSWMVEADGTALFSMRGSTDFKDPGRELHLFERDGAIERLDGWSVDMDKSTLERLIWVKQGDARSGSVVWARAVSAKDKTGQKVSYLRDNI